MKRMQLVAQIMAAVLLSLIKPVSAEGQTWLEVESTYAGDGNFAYRIGSRPHPIIREFLAAGFAIWTTNTVEPATAPPGWTNNPPNQAQWGVEDQYTFWQPPVYDAHFGFRSSMTNYTFGMATLVMSLTLFDYSGMAGRYYSVNIVGYHNFPVLVPSPNPADPSEPTTFYTNSVLPGVEIVDVLRDGDRIRGLAFNAPYSATYRVEASDGLSAWRPVSYAHGAQGRTTWVHATDLNEWGSYFRLAHMTLEQVPFTELPPLDSADDVAAKAMPLPQSERIKSRLRMDRGVMLLQAPATRGAHYRVKVLSDGNPIWQQQVTASSDSLAITIPRSELPASGLFVIQELP